MVGYCWSPVERQKSLDEAGLGQRDGRDKGKKGIKDSKWIAPPYQAKGLSVDCGILRDGREDSCWKRDPGMLRLITRNLNTSFSLISLGLSLLCENSASKV